MTFRFSANDPGLASHQIKDEETSRKQVSVLSVMLFTFRNSIKNLFVFYVEDSHFSFNHSHYNKISRLAKTAMVG